MHDPFLIDHRYCGPPRSGNGGWTCGAVAAYITGRAEVTLRRPPPLDTPLEVHLGDEVSIRHEGEVIAEGRAVQEDALPWPPFVAPEQARSAEARYRGHHHHAFPRCFTCGTERAVGDGLRIFTGPVDGQPDLVAATWSPSPTVTGDAGEVPDPIVWAALDCPSAWPYLGDGDIVAVLGRMTAEIRQPPVGGRDYVVVGERTGSEGRKLFARSALYTADGDPVAVARATWITIEQQ
jgi:hypothetical protein